jgi:sortase A
MTMETDEQERTAGAATALEPAESDVTSPISDVTSPMPDRLADSAVDDVTEPEQPAGRARRARSFEARLAASALTILAVGLLGFVVFLLVISPQQQRDDQARLHASFRGQVAEEVVPTGGLIDPGTPVARLTIPGLSTDQVVVEGTTGGDLQSGPGHRRDSPLPGQAGWSLIYGKAVTFGAPFGQINRLQRGDPISVLTGQGTFTYQVRDVRHVGDPVPPAPGPNSGRLTLVTSDGANVLQHAGTVFVDADLLGRPGPAGGQPPTLIPPEENEMASDTSVNTAIVLWLQALGVLLGGIVWARRRWGGRQALLVGVPLVAAVVWNVYQTAADLLPNLL